ncbi:MAG: gamma-glutamylcyclotransferase [Defluviicoccus sp.]
MTTSAAGALTDAAAVPAVAGPLHVFAYGSLMWDPGFPVAATAVARLAGYHRALCILSIRNRGTAERPGLVVGLTPGGSCVGQVLRVADDDAPAALNHLAARELSTHAYVPRHLAVRLDDGRRVKALAFIARPDHPQFVTRLSVAEQAALVAQGAGPYGSALDYLRNLCRALDDRGLPDGPLHRVLTAAEALAAPPARNDPPARKPPPVAPSP